MLARVALAKTPATRSRIAPHLAGLVLGLMFLVPAARSAAAVEQWGMFEVSLRAPKTGNPFLDVRFGAHFAQGFDSIEVAGFYDGGGVYRVRFMPPSKGLWSYKPKSNVPELDGKVGTFKVTAPSRNNHGPVRVANTYHFAYADGTPYNPLGTTAYVWNLQGDKLEKQTLKTLAKAPFNKIRFCVFPKRYSWNKNEPPMYPFEGKRGSFDKKRFTPAYSAPCQCPPRNEDFWSRSTRTRFSTRRDWPKRPFLDRH